jgi:hypothetical protein
MNASFASTHGNSMVIFDHIESLKPCGFLVGDTIPPLVKIPVKIKAIAKTIPKVSSAFACKQRKKS